MSRKKIIGGYPHLIKPAKLYDIPSLEVARCFIQKDPVSYIHIPMLADRSAMDWFKLKVGFRVLFKRTPCQYHLYLSLERAKSFLEDTADTIDQIAAKGCFDTYIVFSTAFRKAFGIPPPTYRNRQTV